MSVYPDKICHLQLNSRHIILFRLKSHHFRTYFVYMIRYNNVSRPPATLHNLPSPKSGVVTFQTPRIELSPVFIQSRLFNSKHSFAGVWIHKPPLYYAHEYGDEVVGKVCIIISWHFARSFICAAWSCWSHAATRTNVWWAHVGSHVTIISLRPSGLFPSPG